MTQYDYTSSTSSEGEESSSAIKADIERTRSQMSSKIDEIQERLSPDTLKNQAQDAVRGAVQEGTDAVMGYLRGNGSEITHTLVDTIRRNPVPTALIGLGIGWLLVENMTGRSQQRSEQDWRNYDEMATGGYPERYRDQSSSYSYNQYGNYGERGSQGDLRRSGYSESEGSSSGGLMGQVRDKVSQVGEAVGDAVGQVTDKAQELGSQVSGSVSQLGQQGKSQMRNVGSQTQGVLESSPLTLGLTALALGAVVGLALPATQREREMLGPWRDQVVDKAKSTAGDVANRVQGVVDEVKPELEQIANRVIDDVTKTGKEAVSEVKSSVGKAAKRTGEELNDVAGQTRTTLTEGAQ